MPGPRAVTGPLALVGGDEFHHGNEPHDDLLTRAAGDGPAFVVATAAARQHPEAAVRTAVQWFSRFGIVVAELPVRSRGQAGDPDVAALAGTGRFFYLTGGDPGLTVEVLRGSVVWSAIHDAWRAGAAIGGSSAGAMALCEWSLIRHGFPSHRERWYRAALGVVPHTAVIPHFETFGRGWLPSARAAAPAAGIALLGIDERTAAVWDRGGWRATGAGRVTVIRGDDEATFGPGAAIEGLPRPGR